MAVLMRQDVPTMTTQQFEALFGPLADQIKSFPGFIAHASGPIQGGYQVTEVWESQPAHERWVREVIMPTMQKAGITQSLPPSQYVELNRYFGR